MVYDYEFITPAAPNFEGALETLQPFDSVFDNFSRVRFITDSESQVHEVRLFSDEDDDGWIWNVGAFYLEEDQRTFLAVSYTHLTLPTTPYV